VNDLTDKPLGDARTSREDWLNLAMGILVSDGVEQVKILNLAQSLGVSRSSFYWFFKSRQDLLDQLLDHWERTNTAAIVSHADRSADTVAGAVLNVFECWVDESVFDPRLDFAVREWARRSDPVRRVLDRADQSRVDAIAAMFRRHGFDEREAFVRARILYFMQIGYFALELQESMSFRMNYVRDYVRGFCGEAPDDAEFARFAAVVDRVSARDGEG
jgi:AcrR family transcriptional regulator